jgi:hypothetical protein
LEDAMTLRPYHYYMIGALGFSLWVGTTVFALQVALRLTE